MVADPLQPSALSGCANAICTTEAVTRAEVFPLSANVLIVTVGSKLTKSQTYNSSISAYQNAIANGLLNQGQSLSSLYVELDSSNYTAITGAANPSTIYGAGPVRDMGETAIKLASLPIKTAINNLETITGAHYLVILGDADVVIMP